MKTTPNRPLEYTDLFQGGGAAPMYVMDYDTATKLDGTPSAALVAASEEAAPTGAVAAYCDDAGVWQHVREDRESDARARGLAVRTVYIAAEGALPSDRSEVPS